MECSIHILRRPWLRARAVDSNAELVVSYFCTKIEAFIQDVLTVTIGVTDWIIRYEFQSRGRSVGLFSF